MSEAYKQAGVDIDAGEEAVGMIRKHVESTRRPGFGTQIGGFGGFSSLMRLPSGYRIVGSTTDGVGTKLLLAVVLDRHDTVGIDLVAMCANDLLVQGLEPWTFLDYIACGRQIPERTERIVSGIAEGCHQAKIQIVGGEMAEMPDMYDDLLYDLAGFAVGVAKNNGRLITGERIRPGMRVYALPASGVHSNGFNLIRKVFGITLDDHDVTRNILATQYGILRRSLGEELLEPTFIYVRAVAELRAKYDVAGLVNITGGGLIDNPPRILPEGCAIRIGLTKWEVPPIFRLIQQNGRVPLQDMLRTFNMGLGMLVITPDKIDTEAVLVGEVAGSKNKATQFIDGDALFL